MSQSFTPSPEGSTSLAGEPGEPGWQGSESAWTVTDPGLPQAHGWAPQAPAWGPPQAAVAPPAAVLRTSRRRRGLVLGLVGAAGVVAGAVAAGILVTSVFLSSAQDIGKQMASGMGKQIGTSIGDSMAQKLQDTLGADGTGGLSGSAGGAVDTTTVEQFDPKAPGKLGPDPVLNTYAQQCFTGTLQSCDDLYNEAAPLSEYERYAETCGGRVRPLAVELCTDLG